MKQREMLSLLLLIPFSPSTLGDTVLFKNGERRSCLIQGVEGNEILLQNQSAKGVSAVWTRVPKGDVKGIEFETDVGRDSFIREAPISQIPQLRSLWLRLVPLIKQPSCPACRVGLRLGLLLLDSKDSKEIMEADHLFTLISKEAPTTEEREAATQGILRSLIRRGMALEASVEAEKLLKTKTGPGLEAEALLVIAANTQRNLRKHLDEHPRWQKDPYAKGDHLLLLNRTLSLYLEAALLQDAPSDIVQRGLWGAFELSLRYDLGNQATEIARDLVAFYPSSGLAQKAQEYLAQQSQTNTETQEPAQAETETAQSQPVKGKPSDAKTNPATTRKDSPIPSSAADSMRR